MIHHTRRFRFTNETGRSRQAHIPAESMRSIVIALVTRPLEASREASVATEALRHFPTRELSVGSTPTLVRDLSPPADLTLLCTASHGSACHLPFRCGILVPSIPSEVVHTQKPPTLFD